MILVTGATGNVGSEVVEQLVSAGHPVRVLVRDERKVAHLAKQVQKAVGDLDKPETLPAAMQGIDKMFLVITGNGAVQTQNALAAAKQAGVRHIVKLSSSTVRYPVKIGEWHREREKLVAESGIASTFIRPGAFMANALRWAPMIRSQAAVFQAGTDGKTPAIDEKDIASVSVVALTRPGHEGKSYEISGPVAISAAEQVAILSKVLGKPVRIVDVPEAAAADSMRKGGMPPAMVDAVLELIRLARSAGAVEVSPVVEQLTGATARTFESWCQDHVAAFA
jgi:uncharacterized protein YbjT (DUF2867 family)